VTDTVDSSVPQRSLPSALIVAMRPRQWAKNVLVFAAPLAAGQLFVPEILLPSLGAFVVFCLISSGTYLINDIRDVESDREHPKKYARPIAAGQLSVPLAITAAVVLVAASLSLAAVISWALLGVVVAYAVFTLAYSMGLKHEPVIELALLALGFLLRAIADRFVRDGSNGNDATPRRKSLNGYTLGYLRFVWGVAAAVTITSYCLWAFDVAETPSSFPWAEWSVLPFVLAILRYGVSVDRGAAEAPEDTALHDRVLLLLGLAWLVLFGLGALGA